MKTSGQTTITRAQYFELLKQMFKKCGIIFDVRNPKKINQSFGINEYDFEQLDDLKNDEKAKEKKRSLKYSVITDKNVIKVVKKKNEEIKFLNGKQEKIKKDLIDLELIKFNPMVSKLREFNAKENLPHKRLAEPLLSICLSFLNLKSVHDLKIDPKEELTKDLTSDNRVSSNTLVDDFEDAEKYKNYTFFLGAYFSVLAFKIKYIIIGVDLTEPLNTGFPKTFNAIQFGIHNIDKIKKRNRLYKGQATLEETREIHYYLHLNLSECNKRERSLESRVNITALFKNDLKIRKQKIGKAIIQCVSQEAGLLGYELILIRITSKKSILPYDLVNEMRSLKNSFEVSEFVEEKLFEQKEVKTYLGMYLVLHQNSFRVSKIVPKSISDLVARKIPVKRYKYIIGNYRLWHFNRGVQKDKSGNKIRKIIQSIFVILADGTGYLYPFIPSESKLDESGKQMQVQPAMIDINETDPQNPKLWVATFGRMGIGLSTINIALFNYRDPASIQNPFLDKEAGKIIYGQFVSVGLKETGLVSNFVIMHKEDVIINNPAELLKDEGAINNDFVPMDFYIKEDAAFKENKKRKNKYTIQKFIDKHKHLASFYESFKRFIKNRKEESWWYEEFENQ
jgi:hypothetical protein